LEMGEGVRCVYRRRDRWV